MIEAVGAEAMTRGPVADASSHAAASARLSAALVFAIAVAPFVGGIRGPAVYIGWVVLPLLTDAGTRTRLLAQLVPRVSTVGSAGLGIACALTLLALRPWWPAPLSFVQTLPTLHAPMIGRHTWLLVALVPFGHVAHELFYRGLLQQELARRLHSTLQGGLIAGVLFSWTHVLVFQSAVRLPPADFAGLMVFTGLESAVAGSLLAATGCLADAVAFRAANLIVIMAVLLDLAHP